MKRIALAAPLLLSILACGSNPPPPAPAPTSAVESTPPPPAPAETAPKQAEPTPEEKKKQEAIEALAKDRAKWQSDMETEKARWTPEMKAAAQKLADTSFTSGHEAIKAAATAKSRKPENAARDKYRHPVETMDFFGFKPTMTVIEYGPGEGWYTELLAPALAKKGKLLDTSSDPNGPATERSTFNGEKWKGFLASSPELYGKVETIVVAKDATDLGHDGQADMVLATRELHGMVNSHKLGDWLASFHKALKPGGILAIEEHRAAPDANPEESAKKGYLPEKFVIEQVEAAGFKLAGKSEINANKLDTKDYPDGVWDLPPTLRKGDTDKDKYMKIGESDRMTLKFTKIAPKKDAAAPKKDATAKPADKK